MSSLRIIRELEKGALRFGLPVLNAAISMALRRWKADDAAIVNRLNEATFFEPREAATVADAIFRVNANAWITGMTVSALDLKLLPAGIRTLASHTPIDIAVRNLRPQMIFTVTPTAALRFFDTLRPSGPVEMAGLEEQLLLFQDEAFSLAITTDRTLLDNASALLRQSLEEGATTVRQSVLSLERLGVTSRNPQYADMVFRTNINRTYNQGYYDQVAGNPKIREDFPIWEYDAIEDIRLRPEHRANLTRGIDGTQFYPANVTFEVARGPNPFNCRCRLLRWLHVTEAREKGLVPDAS